MKSLKSKEKFGEIQLEYVRKHYSRKQCEKCQRANKGDDMLLCDICDDGYHMFCLKVPLLEIPDQDWYCPPCQEKIEEIELRDQRQKNLKQTKISSHFGFSQKKSLCIKCQKPIKSQKKQCIKCQNQFHQKCFARKKSAIICEKCDEKVRKSLCRNENSLLNFFCAGKNDVKMTKKKKKKRNCFTRQPRAQFLLPKQLKNKKLAAKLKFSLAYGLKAKGILFNDDLCYSNPECGENCNRTCLEGELQRISAANLKVFKKFKLMTRQGIYAPMLIEEDQIQGFIVRAAADIPSHTLLSEYVGEVDFVKNRLFDENDSIMDLLKTPHSQTSLVICPERQGNIARFLSGVNNFNESSLQKQNVQSIRFNIEGQARVVLYSNKRIYRGDVLYYDYNEGGFEGYPTEDFI